MPRYYPQLLITAMIAMGSNLGAAEDSSQSLANRTIRVETAENTGNVESVSLGSLDYELGSDLDLDYPVTSERVDEWDISRIELAEDPSLNLLFENESDPMDLGLSEIEDNLKNPVSNFEYRADPLSFNGGEERDTFDGFMDNSESDLSSSEINDALDSLLSIDESPVPTTVAVEKNAVEASTLAESTPDTEEAVEASTLAESAPDAEETVEASTLAESAPDAEETVEASTLAESAPDAEETVEASTLAESAPDAEETVEASTLAESAPDTEEAVEASTLAESTLDAEETVEASTLAESTPDTEEAVEASTLAESTPDTEEAVEASTLAESTPDTEEAVEASTLAESTPDTEEAVEASTLAESTPDTEEAVEASTLAESTPDTEEAVEASTLAESTPEAEEAVEASTLAESTPEAEEAVEASTLAESTPDAEEAKITESVAEVSSEESNQVVAEDNLTNKLNTDTAETNPLKLDPANSLTDFLWDPSNYSNLEEAVKSTETPKASEQTAEIQALPTSLENTQANVSEEDAKDAFDAVSDLKETLNSTPKVTATTKTEKASKAEAAKVMVQAEAEKASKAEVVKLMAQVEAEKAARAETVKIMAQAEAEKAEAVRLAQVEAEKAEAVRLSQVEAEKAEAVRLAQVEAEKAEAVRLAQVEAEKAEAVRLAKVEAEKAEAVRLAKVEAEKAEAVRLAKVEAEKAEAVRLAKVEAEKAEAVRLAKVEAEKAEAVRLAQVEAEKAEAVRLAQVEAEKSTQTVESKQVANRSYSRNSPSNSSTNAVIKEATNRFREAKENVNPTQKVAPIPTYTASVNGMESSSLVNMTKLSEALGHIIAKNLETPGFQFQLGSIIKGMTDAQKGITSPMKESEYEDSLAQLQENAFNNVADQNLAKAESFMKVNAQGIEVVELEKGKLQYQVIESGNGKLVDKHTAPLIHYTGKYIDGSVFGSSEDAGGPVTIPLDQTIPGFSQAIVGMKEGERRRVFIHPELGYGTAGNFPPNSLLTFDIEIVRVGPLLTPVEEGIAEDRSSNNEQRRAVR